MVEPVGYVKSEKEKAEKSYDRPLKMFLRIAMEKMKQICFLQLQRVGPEAMDSDKRKADFDKEKRHDKGPIQQYCDLS